jgi:triacylglycerol lipase
MPAPLPAGYDNAPALRLAEACQLAYNQFDNPETFNPPPGYQIHAEFTARVLGRTEKFGFLMSSAAEHILAFRGTQSFADAIADSTYAQVSCPFAANAGQTHAGFTEVYTSCRDDVQATLPGLARTLPLFVTGHSLGGAAAVLAALDIAVNSPFKNPVMYKFAGPRVGDPTFADAFDSAIVIGNTSSSRIVNMFDLVPLLPPEKVFDPISEQYFYYRHVDEWFPIGFLKGGVQENHALQNYAAKVRQLAG